MRLLATEFRRFWGRRLVWMTSTVVLIATALGVVAGFLVYRDTPYDPARQADEAAALTDECVAAWMGYDLDRSEVLRGFGVDASDVSDAAFGRHLVEKPGRPCYTDPTELGLV